MEYYAFSLFYQFPNFAQHCQILLPKARKQAEPMLSRGWRSEAHLPCVLPYLRGAVPLPHPYNRPCYGAMFSSEADST